ncbi:nicotinate-nucleotide adenylyltransferase [Ornithinibacillus contaminans]|uniref:nicotinate-nucleotide adenylyltransferase n=1 Tax=Ornithinibacillus contaminans TaxID=694055 RepID=UPI00064DDFB5|nr:nicotinate-nucleotide adenylyltransferase [Ornithinibacillus contaminans]
MKRIGILGGTFDPPHIGHFIIAEEVRTALQLEAVWFIPTYEPPHKHEAATDAVSRWEMLNLVLANHASFQLNTIEIDRSGKSYTIDTMVELKKRYPETEFYFIIGADMVEYLPNWYRIDELQELVNFVGVKRAGYQLETTYPIIQVEIPMVDVSSSMIRDRIMANQSIKYLVPETVHTYIKEHGLYENK